METICLLEGNIQERKGLLNKIKESLSDCEISIFDENDYYDNVSQVITEMSCFGLRRLIILKSLPQVRGAKKNAEDQKKARDKVIRDFKKLFPLIPTGNILIFNNVGITAKSFYKEVEKYGSVHIFKQKISKSDAKQEIQVYFKKYKIEINDDVSSLITDFLDITGQGDNIIDVDKLFLILLKLYHYKSDNSSITKTDVYNVCSDFREFMIWSLYKIFDGLDNEDSETRYNRSLVMVMNYLKKSKSLIQPVILLMQSMLWRYGLVLLIKNGISLRLSSEEIQNEISNIIKLKSSGNKQRKVMSPKDDSFKPEYSTGMMYSVMQARYGKSVVMQYTFDELSSIYHTLSKAIVKLRSGCQEAEVKIILQIVFLTICGKLGFRTSSAEILEPKRMFREIV